MAISHLPFDHALIALVLVLSVIEWLWVYPRLTRSIAAGAPGARGRLYAWIVFELWLLGAVVAVGWPALGRSWATLRLGTGSPMQMLTGAGIAILFAVFLGSQRRTLLRKPEVLQRVMTRAAYADPLIPRTPAQHRVFMLISISAGVFEELFFRGFAMAYFAAWGGTVAAVFLSSVLFGLGHLYLGWKHVIRTAVLGVFFALIALAAGSLWPGMLIHALIDMNSGDLGYRAFGEDRDRSRAGSPATA